VLNHDGAYVEPDKRVAGVQAERTRRQGVRSLDGELIAGRIVRRMLKPGS